MRNNRPTHNRILRWGVLGTARINRALIPPLRDSRRNQLAAVASRSIDRAREYAQTWDIPNTYSRYEDLLADPDIDIVYISLPNHLHAEWTIKAAQAGKHVLCEKPLALSLDEVDAIQASAQQTGVIVMEAFMYRHHPQTLKVLEIVSTGQLGPINLIRGAFTFLLDRPNDIRWNPDYGGGSLWDVGCYPVSYSMMLTGSAPLEVFGWQVPAPSNVDLTFAGQLRFPGDIISQFNSGFGLPFFAQMHIRGTQGNLFIPAPFKPDPKEIVLLNNGSREQKFSFENISPYLCEVEDMANAVLDGKPPRLSLGQSRLHIATLLALYESARTGKPVLLENK